MGERLLLLTTCACCAALAAGCDVISPGPRAQGQAPGTRAAALRAEGSLVGKLRVPRRDHAAALLGDGRVLLAGGETLEGEPVADVELYEPLTGVWTEAPPMLAPRSRATATLLADGRVLVSGGLGWLEDGSLGPLDTQELFDPRAGTWQPTGPLSVARADHTATRLLDGRVFLAGGQSTAARVGSDSTELYLPDLGETIAVRTPMSTRRFAHSALRLPSGDVLLAGGDVEDITWGTARTELYQPDQGGFLPQAPLEDLRFHHSATLLHSGRVALVGGRGSGARAGQSAATTFVWSPTPGSWAQGPRVSQARESHSGTLLPSGRLLVAGGWRVSSPASGPVQYAPVPSWERVTEDGLGWEEQPLLHARARHSATLLPTGEVLLAGGETQLDGVPALLPPTELLDFAQDAWSAAPGAARAWARSVLLLDGRVLVVGAPAPDAGLVAPGELLSADGAGVTPLPGAPARAEGSSTLLESGQVLLLGGLDSAGTGLAAAALFDPANEQFYDLEPMLEGRARHSATLLPNGNVLVAGGIGAEGKATRSVELYDPQQGSWRLAEALTEPRAGHSATLLADGRVLLAGGADGRGNALQSVELYDPRTQRFSHVPLPELLGRERHAALLAPDGSVLLVGGRALDTPRPEVERLTVERLGPAPDPLTPEEPPPASDLVSVHVADLLPEPRLSPTLTLLLNGRVLVAGGEDLKGRALGSALVLDPRSGRTLGPAARAPFAPGAGAAATLLPDGRVLVAGGGGPPQRYDEGRSAPEHTRPQLLKVPAAGAPAQELEVQGRGLTGVTEASGGTARSPATDVPLLLLRRSDGSLQAFASTGAFGATSAQARLPLLPGGPHWLYPVTNGAVGVARPLQLGLRRGELCKADGDCASGACASGVCCDGPCGADSCGSGTCIQKLVGEQVPDPLTGAPDGGVEPEPGEYVPVPTPLVGEGGSREGVAPSFASEQGRARARCAELFVSTPAVEGTGPFAFALEGPAPAGVSVDAATGELRWRPTSAQAGRHLVQRRVSSPLGEAVEQLEVDVACEAAQLAVGCGCSGSGGSGQAAGLAAAGALLVLLRRRRRRAAAGPPALAP